MEKRSGGNSWTGQTCLHSSVVDDDVDAACHSVDRVQVGEVHVVGFAYSALGEFVEGFPVEVDEADGGPGGG